MSTMTEENFKNQFICQFLATWCATHYDEYCSHGLHDRLENPPVEDAEFLAQKAWERIKE